MATESQRYQRRTYLFMCTDPVHVGTGGYRLGRVDNSIAREPGTNVPKIPGTSLHGAARAYAASLYEKSPCAGQGQPKEGDVATGHCGNCKICYTFGYTKNTGSQEAYSGVVNVFDAQLLFFPVHSMAGPVWITTPSRLELAGFEISKPKVVLSTETVFLSFKHEGPLNLGWLVFQTGNQIEITTRAYALSNEKRWGEIKKRIVLVHENLFSHIVNSNLEVRTSVAIDPERGAAIDKALFTYEALPRTTVLSADVVLDDYRESGFNNDGIPSNQTSKRNPLPGGADWKSAIDVLHSGLKMIEWLGVGGMGTRGFGRMALLGIPKNETYGEEVKS
jgi:CRISPR-associated protein Cmr4